MSRNACLRFDSEEQLRAHQSARRERFQKGQTHAPEKDVLASVLELLRLHPLVAWIARANTGSGYLLRADVFKRLVAAGHLKPTEARFMRFGVKGAADLTGQLRNGLRLEVECKSDTGKLSDEQDAFLSGVNGAGGVAFVARSADDVMRGLG